MLKHICLFVVATYIYMLTYLILCDVFELYAYPFNTAEHLLALIVIYIATTIVGLAISERDVFVSYMGLNIFIMFIWFLSVLIALIFVNEYMFHYLRQFVKYIHGSSNGDLIHIASILDQTNISSHALIVLELVAPDEGGIIWLPALLTYMVVSVLHGYNEKSFLILDRDKPIADLKETMFIWCGLCLVVLLGFLKWQSMLVLSHY